MGGNCMNDVTTKHCSLSSATYQSRSAACWVRSLMSSLHEILSLPPYSFTMSFDIVNVYTAINVCTRWRTNTLTASDGSLTLTALPCITALHRNACHRNAFSVNASTCDAVRHRNAGHPMWKNVNCTWRQWQRVYEVERVSKTFTRLTLCYNFYTDERMQYYWRRLRRIASLCAYRVYTWLKIK